MFDVRLTFAAGSSRDGDTPGLAMLTNVMLNEGVAGSDANAIAQGFESLGAQYAPALIWIRRKSPCAASAPRTNANRH